MRRSNLLTSSVARIGAPTAMVLGMFMASCAVQSPDEAASTSDQAVTVEIGTRAPDIKLTPSSADFEPFDIGPSGRGPSDLPPGWDAVPNGCNGQSDLGCQGFDDLGNGCDLMADGICRAYSPSAFSANKDKYLWTCRCEKPDFYRESTTP